MTLESILNKLDNFWEFEEKNRVSSNGLILGNHQLVPIFDAIENGLKRFILVYGTGAGKTIIPMEIIKQKKRKGENPKVLIMAPKNTLLDENTRSELNGLEKEGMFIHRIEDRSDAVIPENADVVVVNYEKLSPRLSYLPQLINFSKSANIIIPDEFQDIRNKNAVYSKGYQEIILASKDAALIGLSASPIYDKLTDAAMLLFTIDPERYGHYKDIPFNIEEDKEALFEMREKGQIRFFDKEDIARFYNLPNFIEHEPRLVRMPEKYISQYLEVYKGVFKGGEGRNISRLITLERIAINSMLESPDTAEFLRERINKGHVMNFFSHLMHEPKGGTPDDAIFRKLENLLRKLGAKNVQVIGGHVSYQKRKEIQQMMKNGDVDALINQWRCTSQGFSETAGNRPITLVPLRSPYAPGTHLQIIGRSWRPGQKAIVEYIELHAHSSILLENIESYVRDYAKKNKLKVKSTWEPSLFHADAYKVRKSKEKVTFLFFSSHSQPLTYTDELDVSSYKDYAKMLSNERIIDYSIRGRLEFGTGTRRVIRFVGKPYEYGLKVNIDPLAKDYNRDDILLCTAGKINWFLAEAIEKIKERERVKNESWRIADLGCCSSGVFTQARLIYQALQSLRDKDINLDHIINIDGNSALISNTKDFLKRKDWLDAIKDISVAGYSKEEIIDAIEMLKDKDYMKNLEFLTLNFATEKIPGIHDVVITSQCLQYNDQANNRDIEKIVKNINHALPKGGHYLSILTGNSRQKSFTSENDIDNFGIILSAYGFDIKRYEHIEGKKEKEVVVRPFHYFHSVKKEDAPSNLARFQTVPVVYSDTIEVLTGGHKKLSFRDSTGKRSTQSIQMPNIYVGKNGRKIIL